MPGDKRGLCIRQKSRLTAVINELYGQLQGLKKSNHQATRTAFNKGGEKRGSRTFFRCYLTSKYISVPIKTYMKAKICILSDNVADCGRIAPISFTKS